MASNPVTLVSLAILKVDLDDGRRDYLGYFENFVISLLRHNDIDPVTDTEVAELFEKDYGLRIPQKAAQLLLRRLAKKQLLRREYNTYKIVGELPPVDLSAKREIAQRGIDEVYEALRKYAKSNFNLEWSDEELNDVIFGFLNKFGVDCIRAYVYRTALPTVPGDVEASLYVFSRFISDLHHHKDPLFESVIVLVKGLMYANALICPDLESIQKDFRRVSFYLDTPVIFDVLGINGEESRGATLELVSLVNQLNGKVAIFEHTLSEVDGVLEYAENNIDVPKAVSRIMIALRSRKIKRGDIALLRNDLRDELVDMNIKILKTPKYKEKYQIDEKKLEDMLKVRVRSMSVGGLRYDVNSIRSIFVLREGQSPTRLEDAKAVFVTDNESLAKASFEFGKNHNSTREVSPAITDYSLANVAWLKAPLGAPALPEKETLAACYAAMEPRASLWGKYLSELESLESKGKISPDDHAVLRVSGIAVDELMNMTLGDEAAFGGGTVSVILARVKDSYSAESIEALAVEERAHALTRDEMGRVERREQHTMRRLYWLSNSISKIPTFLLSVLVIAALLLAAFASSTLTSNFISQTNQIGVAVNILLLLVALWGVYSSFVGTAIGDSIRNLRHALQDWIFKKLRQWFIGE